MKEDRSIELARYRIEKAQRNLQSAKNAFAFSDYEETVSCSYYTIFTAMRALLALKNSDSKSHAGVLTLFSQHYIKGHL